MHELLTALEGVFGLGLILSPFGVLVWKGRPWQMLWTFMPLCGYWIVVVQACRLAHPRSRWARRFYDEAKTGRAHLRYDQLPPTVVTPEQRLLEIDASTQQRPDLPLVTAVGDGNGLRRTAAMSDARRDPFPPPGGWRAGEESVAPVSKAAEELRSRRAAEAVERAEAARQEALTVRLTPEESRFIEADELRRHLEAGGDLPALAPGAVVLDESETLVARVPATLQEFRGDDEGYTLQQIGDVQDRPLQAVHRTLKSSQSHGFTHPDFDGVDSSTLRYWLDWWSDPARTPHGAEEKGRDPATEAARVRAELEARYDAGVLRKPPMGLKELRNT